MRGKVRQYEDNDTDDGITPAHAGKSPGRSCTYSSRWDHPRPCGEKIHGPSFPNNVIGSPPPMRGKEVELLPGVAVGRITPAHAGKSRQIIKSII